MEAAAKCMLVLIGATRRARRNSSVSRSGYAKSAQSWRELLVDIKQRGLEIAPDLALGDGALGFWKAMEEVFPGTRQQPPQDRGDDLKGENQLPKIIQGVKFQNGIEVIDPVRPPPERHRGCHS
jgi:hypothetical protein